MLKNIAYIVARFVAAFLMGQTLYFKFSGAEESMYIFNVIGMEPSGRWIVGTLELIAVILLLVPKTAWLGGIATVAIMAGAIGLHLAILGIKITDHGGKIIDDGTLFVYSIIVFLCGLYVTFTNKEKIVTEILPKFLGKK